MKVDGLYFSFADDIALIMLNIERTERMFAVRQCLWEDQLETELIETMFMSSGCIPDASFMLIGTNISECSSYVHLVQHDERSNYWTGRNETRWMRSIQE
uniref:Uncharacterized protein n=1 Tax=Haemonchus contortus TaxID=6289 RepID=A0A7I4Y4L4_HAECO